MRGQSDWPHTESVISQLIDELQRECQSCECSPVVLVPLPCQHSLQLDAGGDDEGDAQQGQTNTAPCTVAPGGWPALLWGSRLAGHTTDLWAGVCVCGCVCEGVQGRLQSALDKAFCLS